MTRRRGVPIAVADRAAVASNQPADFARPRHRSRRVAGADRAEVVVANQPAEGGAAARHRPRRVAGADRAAAVVANQPADEVGPRHRPRRVAGADRAAVVPAYQPAEELRPSYRIGHQPDITDRAAVHIAEQTDVVATCPIDRQIADRVAEALEHTSKGVAAVADRDKSRPRVPARRRSRIDIGTEHVVAGQPRRVDVLQLGQRLDDAIGRGRRAGVAAQIHYPVYRAESRVRQQIRRRLIAAIRPNSRIEAARQGRRQLRRRQACRPAAAP